MARTHLKRLSIALDQFELNSFIYDQKNKPKNKTPVQKVDGCKKNGKLAKCGTRFYIPFLYPRRRLESITMGKFIRDKWLAM